MSNVTKTTSIIDNELTFISVSKYAKIKRCWWLRKRYKDALGTTDIHKQQVLMLWKNRNSVKIGFKLDGNRMAILGTQTMLFEASNRSVLFQDNSRPFSNFWVKSSVLRRHQTKEWCLQRTCLDLGISFLLVPFHKAIKSFFSDCLDVEYSFSFGEPSERLQWSHFKYWCHWRSRIFDGHVTNDSLWRSLVDLEVWNNGSFGSISLYLPLCAFEKALKRKTLYATRNAWEPFLLKLMWVSHSLISKNNLSQGWLKQRMRQRLDVRGLWQFVERFEFGLSRQAEKRLNTVIQEAGYCYIAL